LIHHDQIVEVVSVEIGRGSVPSHFQPSFTKLEEALNAIPSDK
jgi:hypothetical protein